jgi:protein phosphatase slingshot
MGYSDNVNVCHDDKLEDYEKHIDNIDKYTDEANNKRIFPKQPILCELYGLLEYPSLIIDNIYIGSAYNAASFQTLIDNNIATIVNVTCEIRNYFPDNFTYHRFMIYDDNKSSIAKYLDESYQIIKNEQKKNNGNILIHCFMGASRSVSIVMYYLAKEYNMNFDEALNHIKNIRPFINPTFRYTKDLISEMYHM